MLWHQIKPDLCRQHTVCKQLRKWLKNQIQEILHKVKSSWLSNWPSEQDRVVTQHSNGVNELVLNCTCVSEQQPNVLGVPICWTSNQIYNNWAGKQVSSSSGRLQWRAGIKCETVQTSAWISRSAGFGSHPQQIIKLKEEIKEIRCHFNLVLHLYNLIFLITI